MKLRSGFVSNSSSSSFLISLRDLTALQLVKLQQHTEVAGDDAWTLTVGPDSVRGSTDMDNFDMCWFLSELGIDDSKIEWDDRWH